MRLENPHVEGDKSVMEVAALAEIIRNDVWSAIEAVDPILADLQCEIGIDASLPPPVRTYTAVAGDSLWKIADKLYGRVPSSRRSSRRTPAS